VVWVQEPPAAVCRTQVALRLTFFLKPSTAARKRPLPPGCSSSRPPGRSPGPEARPKAPRRPRRLARGNCFERTQPTNSCFMPPSSCWPSGLRTVRLERDRSVPVPRPLGECLLGPRAPARAVGGKAAPRQSRSDGTMLRAAKWPRPPRQPACAPPPPLGGPAGPAPLGHDRWRCLGVVVRCGPPPRGGRAQSRTIAPPARVARRGLTT